VSDERNGLPVDRCEHGARHGLPSPPNAPVQLPYAIDIRRAFEGFPMLGLTIKYSVNNAVAGGASTSRELVISNWEPGTQTNGLF
jgi:DNA adenine methylase